MENIPKLKIKIKDFRAIKSANIILNGITVISGINGCGKSTISKLLYRTIKTSIDYDKIIIKNLSNDLREINNFLYELSHELEFFIRRNSKERETLKREEYDLRFKFRDVFDFNDDIDLKNLENKILEAINFFIKIFAELSPELKKDEKYKLRFYRINRFAKEEFFKKGKDVEDADMPTLLNNLKQKIEIMFKNAHNEIQDRNISILNNEISNYFTENVKVNNFNIEELGALLTNRKEKKLSNFLTITKIAYIDTPIIVGVEDIDMTNIPHWEDLDSLLKSKGKSINKKRKISNILKNQVIDGESKYDNKNENFVYERKDGLVIDLIDCATGLKSFSLMQILYNNGFLDNKTLLIIDEPEVHLHPEWIVQYARLIVMLHKELNVNFLIGSHNPDMVMAIKYIAKKELGDQDNNPVNFYFAKASDKDKYMFNYELNKTDIEPIFGSFNKSFDKINEYGATEED